MAERQYMAMSEWWETRARDSLATQIYEADRSPVFTGLYDAAGNKLFRHDAPNPIGFIISPAPTKEPRDD